MNGKVLVFLAAVCFIQAVKSDSISDLIKELKPQLEAAAKRVATVVAEGGNKSTEAFLSVQSELNVYETQINDARKELLKAVAAAEKKALDAGRDIKVCVKPVLASVEDVVAWQFEKCRLSPELNNLAAELVKLGKQEAVLLASPVKCTIQSGKDLEKIKACVLGAIDVAKKAADKVEAEIEPAVSQALPNAKACGSAHVTELEAKIRTLTQEFNACVLKA